ncbi:hypothetical protein D3C87_1503740 [compost metagenome]
MLGKGRPPDERGIVAFDRRPCGTGDVDVEIAIEHMAELDIGQGEVIARQIFMVGQLPFGNFQQARQSCQRFGDGLRVLLRWRGAHDLPEDRAGKAQGDIELGPFGPFVHLRPTGGIGRPETVRAIAGGQIAQDGAGLPDWFIFAILEYRNQPIGIHGEKFGRVIAAMDMAHIVAEVIQPQLADTPHQRLHIGRGPAAPNGQRHGVDPPSTSFMLTVALPGRSGFCWLSCGTQPASQMISSVARTRPSGSLSRLA